MPIMQRTAKTPAPSSFGLPTLKCGDPPPTPIPSSTYTREHAKSQFFPASSTHISSGVFIPLLFLPRISAILFHLRNMPSLLIYQTEPKQLPTRHCRRNPLQTHKTNRSIHHLHPSLQNYPLLPTANTPHRLLLPPFPITQDPPAQEAHDMTLL